MNGEDYSGLTWLSDTPKPTETELQALWPQVQYELQYESVQQAREAEYRKTTDPLFFKYQAGEATKEEWELARQAIKDAHPYPAEIEVQ
jgi:hypothetical protein